ncbi:MAG: LysM peptidoglycan-binding domain-containing protein [Planctomycetia bacterium]|nr:LysM peptidoglycan-binding domain-containing protein [Planctomycetia bacterium]
MGRRNKHRSRGRDRYDDMFEEMYDDSQEELEEEEYENEDAQEQEVNRSSQNLSRNHPSDLESRRKAAAEERAAWNSLRKDVPEKESSQKTDDPEIPSGPNPLKVLAGRVWGATTWGFCKFFAGVRWLFVRLGKVLGVIFRKLVSASGFFKRVPKKAWLATGAVLLLAGLGGTAYYFLSSGGREVAQAPSSEETPAATPEAAPEAMPEKIPAAVEKPKETEKVEKPVETVEKPAETTDPLAELPADDLSSLPGLELGSVSEPTLPTVESVAVSPEKPVEKPAEKPDGDLEEYDLNNLGLSTDSPTETVESPTPSASPATLDAPLPEAPALAESAAVPDVVADAPPKATLADSLRSAPGANTDHILSDDFDPYALPSSAKPAKPETPAKVERGSLGSVNNIAGLDNSKPAPTPTNQADNAKKKNSVLINGSEGIAKDNVWVVQSGDNYWDISQKVYGTGAYYKAIAQYNSNVVPDPNHLRAGTRLRLPEVSFLHRAYPTLCPVQGRATAGNQYVVQDGDTLSDIARIRLGSASRWPEIYRLNRDRLNNRFDLLPPGITLTLPEREGNAVATEAGVWK